MVGVMDEKTRQQYLKILGVSVWQSKTSVLPTRDKLAVVTETATEDVALVKEEKCLAAADDNANIAASPMNTWQDLQDSIQNCQRCELYQYRQQALMGDGNLQADVVFIGEAPDDIDDKAGHILAGQAGELFDAMLKAINLDRQKIYVLNMLKCKLPDTRTPHTSELLCCDDYLQQQIKLLEPKVIYAMGNAVQHLLLTQQPLAALRRRAHYYNGIPLIVSLSPLQLLQTPEHKRKAWQDLLELKKTLALHSDSH